VLGRVPNQSLNIFFILRDNDPKRLDLKDAGVGAVEGASQLIRKELALESASEVIHQILPLLLVHRLPAGAQPAAHSRFEVGIRSDISASRRSRSCRYRSAIVNSKGLWEMPGVNPR
jgi:hypothetical protein